MCPPPQQQCGVGLLLCGLAAAFFPNKTKRRKIHNNEVLLSNMTPPKSELVFATGARLSTLWSSSKNASLDSGPKNGPGLSSASPFLCVLLVSLNHNVSLAFCLAARDDRIGFLFAALSMPDDKGILGCVFGREISFHLYWCLL